MDVQGCIVKPTSSAMCVLGTKSCEVEHDAMQVLLEEWQAEMDDADAEREAGRDPHV